MSRFKAGQLLRASDLNSIISSEVGELAPYAGAAAPAGWLLCDGSDVSRTTYADLFAVVGTAFGVGDGSTTFGLPDLRGRVPVGLDNMGGSDAGRLSVANTMGGAGGGETHTLAIGEIPAHNHGSSTGGHAHTGSIAGSDSGFVVANPSGGGGLTAGTGTRVRVVGATQSGDGTHTHTTQGSGNAHNNMQPYQLMNWIVCTGVYS